jgi:hypothetical protein
VEQVIDEQHGLIQSFRINEPPAAVKPQNPNP